MQFVCNLCHYRWEGKSLQDRHATNISCSREHCRGSGRIELTDNIVIFAYGLKQLLDASDSIDYVSLEIQTRSMGELPWLRTMNEAIPIRMFYSQDFFE